MPFSRRNHKRQFSEKAFTMIEVLLVVSLLSVTGLAVYHAIANGIRVWEYSRRYSAEEDVQIFLEKLEKDLHNVHPSSVITFAGKTEKLVIPTLVRIMADKKTSDGQQGLMIDQVGAVEYFIQKGKQTLYRTQGNYSQALKKKHTQAREIASSVANLRFTYYVFEDQEFKAKKTVKQQIPSSILVEIDFVEVTGRLRHIQRLINIPLGDRS